MGCLVGFKYYLFHAEIISLLIQKRLDPDFSASEINEVDIYQFDPSELPGLSETNSDDQVWYFFSEPDYKYAKSKRAHRATGGGYWKITGKACKVKDKGSKVIGSKKTLVFYRRHRTSKEAKTDWVMHEFYVNDEDELPYKRDFVFCYVEKKPNNKSNVSTPDDGKPSLSLSSDSESHVTEIPSIEVESQQPSSHHLISNSRNHITETSFLELPQGEPPLPSSDDVDYNPPNHFPETTISMVDPQLLSGNNPDYGPMDPVPESNFPMVEPWRPSSDKLVSDSRYHYPEITYLVVDPQLLAKFNAVNGYNGLYDGSGSGSAVQSPTNPDPGSNSSCSDGISNDCNLPGYQLDRELEDVVDSQRDFQEINPFEVSVLTESEIDEMIKELS